MASVGVLICGYHEEDARTIKAFLDKTLDTYVIMVSASQKADMKIIDILKKGPEECFEEERPRFSCSSVFRKCRPTWFWRVFPSDGGLKRPIFCSLTAQNQQWPLRELIEHLVAEHRQWTGKEA